MKYLRCALECGILFLFDLFPKKLGVRAIGIYWICLPYIFVKFATRAIRKRVGTARPQPRLRRALPPHLHELALIPENSSEEAICVRYSGGTDSTLTAARMAQRFRRVHLVTFASSNQAATLGTIRSNPMNSAQNLRRLQEKFGADRFVHQILPVESLRDEIYFTLFRKHVRSRDFLQVSFCPACTMAMHLLTIEYCEKHNIRFVTDGSTAESGAFSWQMQHADILLLVHEGYRKRGIRYIVNPSYTIDDSAEALYQEGVFPDRVDKGSFTYRRKTQQFCIPIQLQSLCRNIHGAGTPGNPASVKSFVQEVFNHPSLASH
jgi:hypothetical protein